MGCTIVTLFFSTNDRWMNTLLISKRNGLIPAHSSPSIPLFSTFKELLKTPSYARVNPNLRSSTRLKVFQRDVLQLTFFDLLDDVIGQGEALLRVWKRQDLGLVLHCEADGQAAQKHKHTHTHCTNQR